MSSRRDGLCRSADTREQGPGGSQKLSKDDLSHYPFARFSRINDIVLSAFHCHRTVFEMLKAVYSAADHVNQEISSSKPNDSRYLCSPKDSASMLVLARLFRPLRAYWLWHPHIHSRLCHRPRIVLRLRHQLRLPGGTSLPLGRRLRQWMQLLSALWAHHSILRSTQQLDETDLVGLQVHLLRVDISRAMHHSQALH